MRRLLLALLPVSCLAASPATAASDLDAAIADALANAPALAAARAQETAAKARLDRAKAEGNPLLRVEGSVGKGRIDNGGFFGITAANTTPLAVQGTAEMPLYAGGRIAAAIDQASGGAQIAGFQAEHARLQTVVQTISAYAEVLTARKLDARFGRLVTELTEVERQALLRFQSGEIASSELAQARARRAESEAWQARAKGRLASAEAAFERLTGKPAGELAGLPDLPATPPTLDEALDLARAANPSLQQAKTAVDVAKAGARGARAEGMPQVMAFVEADHVRDQFFSDYRADSVAVGIRGRWTLFAGGRVASQARAADADLDASMARLRQADQVLEGLVIDAWTGLAAARRMVEATQLQSEAADEALRGRKLEAQVGAVPVLAVLDAEREAAEARAALLEAQGQRLVAAWQLNALTGGF
ncbi:type I secretion protein TolC [Novosphingobium sp. PC22D]|uniref:TolC family protein n=1 Tax=Novosphingobium sp. PC22D TaxID=1962403 RepID=UPI000BEF2940|nr:TolC family protein [Novosphingobium sp. PC22D]PEQ13793.1 type I secretion protein TolC [Novosphingobium sp. PC22D]